MFVFKSIFPKSDTESFFKNNSLRKQYLHKFQKLKIYIFKKLQLFSAYFSLLYDKFKAKDMLASLQRT